MKKLQFLKKYVKRCAAGCGLAWVLLTTVVGAAVPGVWGNELGAECSVCSGDDDEPKPDETIFWQ